MDVDLKEEESCLDKDEVLLMETETQKEEEMPAQITLEELGIAQHDDAECCKKMINKAFVFRLASRQSEEYSR